MTDTKMLELRSAEMVLIMIEEFVEIERPEGVDAGDALDDFAAKSEGNAQLVDLASNAAHRIVEYFTRQLNGTGAVSGFARVSEEEFRRPKQ